ncbi:TonB-dependent receptor [Winogradskyella endarachnes]|uniref:TonB-dependent receptor plug domain-containing protein n=1 Tax=Winogradskyella endarachnes TaxID=2681965 RepID=A0A6L6U6V5_9FLAO|nr:TonB-dependent receptor [Winogradskyella endarachnes]MUU77306.1 TonB-dependent receptor plug domain-containing protein [Winogradskyella endarachnes]
MKNLLSFLTLLLLSSLAFAQDATIKGAVTDNNNSPLVGVNISIKNTTKGTQTDDNGKFVINSIENGDYTLVISYIGFKTKEVLVSVTDNQNVDLSTIILYEGNEILEEVVLDVDRKNKFSRKTSAYVSKMPLKNIENSQVYNTITNQLLVSQSVNTFEDALKNAAGVTKLWSSTGRSGDGAGYYSSRGFAVQPQLVNGVAGITNGFINPSNIERVEVIKGPSGTLFGSSVTSYGGLINIITKKPYSGTGGEITVSGGSYDFAKFNADVNVSANDKLSFRINSGFQQEHSFQDAGLKKSVFLAPSLTYKINNDVTLNFSYEVSDNEQTNETFLFLNRYGTLAFNSIDDLGYDTNLSFTSNDVTINNLTQNFRGEIAWKITDQWSSQTLISGSSAKSLGYYTYLWNYADYTDLSAIVGTENFALYAQDTDSKTKTINLQQNFTGTFKIGDLENKLLVGADYLDYNIIDNSSNWGYLHTINIDGDLIFGEPEINEENLSAALSGIGNVDSDIRQNIFGAYVSDVINILPSLSVMGSVRYDRFDYQGDRNTDTDDDTEYTESTFSPKFGIVFQPILNELSIFANYQNGFSYVNPEYVTTYDDLGNANTTLESFDVEQANQFEVGAKTNLFNNKLEATLSYYNINVDNKYYWATQTQDLEINSQGIELEVNANPISNLNIHSGFSYNDSEITDSPSARFLEGNRYGESGAEITYNFWADYKFFKNFGVGAGFNGQSKYDTMTDYQAVTGSFYIPAYTIFNASVYYETDKFRVSVKGNNLTDESYYSGWSTITPQQQRVLLGTFTYKF